MIEIKLTIDKVDYDQLLDALIPHLVKNRLAEKTIKSAISSRFASMTESERTSAAAGFLNDNSSKITDIINDYINEQQLGCHVSALEAKEK